MSSKNPKNNTIQKDNRNANNFLKLNKFIANKLVTTIICLVYGTVMFLGLNYVFNMIMSLKDGFLNSKGENIDKSLIDSIQIKNMFLFDKDYYIFYIIVTIGIMILLIKLVYNIQTSYRVLEIGQKGVARWTSEKEIKEQYKAIPLKSKSFEGKGGLPVAEIDDKIFIDDSPVNNLIIGITRSGKGEMYVFKMIDIYSRSQEKSSMIVTDPKLELAPASKETLEKRGYEVHVLNLADPKTSMGYNPLKLIIDAYKEGDMSSAELLCSTFCYSIFNPDEGNGSDKFWANTSIYLLSALILAHVKDCLEADEKINKELKEMYDCGRRKYQSLSKEEKAVKDSQYNERESLLRKLESTSNVIEKVSIKRRLKELQEELDGYVFDNEKLQYTNENEKKINMYSIVKSFAIMANTKNDDGRTTALDDYFNYRDDNDRSKALYAACGLAGGENKGTIFTNTLARLGMFNYADNAKMTAESTIELSDVGYGDKPMAIFISMPDYDKSNHFIASVFIRQLYFVLAKKASYMPNKKCKREVVFLLDEFGNMPAIENMGSIITVCLGRNIKFNLVIQAYSQLKAIYKEESETIIGNCGNHVYIQTEDYETAERYSKLLGKKTITSISRTGEKLSMRKSISESMEERELLNPNELMQLVEGQCIIVRAMKRKDLKGNNVLPLPIFNKDKTMLKLRYTYLLDDFPNGLSWNDMDGIETTVNIKHDERVFDFRKYLEEAKKHEKEEIEFDEEFSLAEEDVIWPIIKDNPIRELDNYNEICKLILSSMKTVVLNKDEFASLTVEEVVEVAKELNIYREVCKLILVQ